MGQDGAMVIDQGSESRVRARTSQMRASRRRPRQATPKSERARHLILEAGIDSLVRHSYHRTSLTRVADLAGITRAGLQYHFPSLDDLMLALCGHVLSWDWRNYEAMARGAPEGRDALDYAIDLVGSHHGERYVIARLELITAARTTPRLLLMMETAAAEVDAMGKRFVDGLTRRPGISDTPRFTAARDLSNIIDAWLLAHVFPPGEREVRARNVLKALRVALYTLWGRPFPGYMTGDYLEGEEAPSKPRVRVAARRPSD
jgi:AcrR family transcriptional regulator